MNLKRLLFGRRLIVLVGVLLTMAAAPVGILTLNQYMNAEATVSDALRLDAEAYATEWGVSVDEAIRRLQLQGTIGEFDSQLEDNEASTFAGLWVEHGAAASDFRVVVRFTEDGEVTVGRYASYVQNGPLANMVEVRGADISLEDLLSARSSAVESLKGLGIPIESGLNVQENRAEIYVVDKSGLESAMGSRNIELPNNIELIRTPSLSSKAADIYGGVHVTACTAGFSVEHDDGDLGITTAGHCGNSQSYDGTDLPYQNGAFNGYYDLQWHTAPGFTVKNKISRGSYTSEITGTRHRDNQSVGNWVCKYGRATGNTCGTIEDKSYEPNYTPQDPSDPECHPGSSCDFSNTWMRVSSNSFDMCTGGDSGGPFFSGGTALGTMAFCLAPDGSANPSGDNDDDEAIYMAVNYFGGFDLTVLTD